MYFPKIEHFIRSDRSDWLIQLLLRFPHLAQSFRCHVRISSRRPGICSAARFTRRRCSATSTLPRSVRSPCRWRWTVRPSRCSARCSGVSRARPVPLQHCVPGRSRPGEQPRSPAADDGARRWVHHCVDDPSRGRDLRRFAHYRPVPKVLRHEPSTQQYGCFRGSSRL